MRYDTIHNTIIHDGTDDDQHDVFDERGVLKAGRVLRVPLMMMDSTQLAIAGNVTTIDAGDVELVSRQELVDWYDAEVSARYRGGLQDGDRVRIGDKDLVVSGRNPATGKIQLRDASTSTQDGNALKQQAYDSYDRDIQSRYLNTHDAKADEACTTAGREKGTWRDRAGRLVCVPDKSSKEQEWDIAGPLSDATRVQARDQAYAQYDHDIQNAWRR